VKLPTAGPNYNQSNESQTRKAIETADEGNFKKGQDVRLARNERLILRSPDGTEWVVSVADDGTLSATEL
jgi:hypothetical protein